MDKDNIQPEQSSELAIRKQVEASLQTSSDLSSLSIKDQIDLFTEIAKDSRTGIETPAMAVMLFQKAKELQIGWANAIPHMHLVQGKLGIDIHIIKAIISKPGSGITVVKTEDFKPIYQYTNSDYSTVWTDDTLPPNARVVDSFEVTPIPTGCFRVIIIPTPTAFDAAGNVTDTRIEPFDYRTTYKFTRKKRDIDGKFIIEERTSSFSWQEALVAGLPMDKSGQFNVNSAWYKYRKMMLDHRAYTFGARDIASDLLLGCYETTELYDMTKSEYPTMDISDTQNAD